jgi:hypothetical protein
LKHTHKHTRWLAYGAVLTGLIIVGLLVLALNRGPLARGFEPDRGGFGLRAFCPWCEEGRPTTMTDIVGMVLIGLVVLVLPAGHLALLVMLAARVVRPPRFSDIVPAHHCPHCNHPLVKQWRNCPYCGQPIDTTHPIAT